MPRKKQPATALTAKLPPPARPKSSPKPAKVEPAITFEDVPRLALADPFIGFDPRVTRYFLSGDPKLKAILNLMKASSSIQAGTVSDVRVGNFALRVMGSFTRKRDDPEDDLEWRREMFPILRQQNRDIDYRIVEVFPIK